MVAPAVLLLEQTAVATLDREPETPNEREFHAEFLAPLKEAIAAFRSAVPTNFGAGGRPAAEVLAPVQALASNIERRCRCCPCPLCIRQHSLAHWLSKLRKYVQTSFDK